MLNLTNYFDHPGDNRYTVFSFYEVEHADYFEQLLIEEGIEFERHLEEDSNTPKILFGISKRFRKEALRCNFLTHGKFRTPFISSPVLKYGLVFITLGLILVGIIGFINSTSGH